MSPDPSYRGRDQAGATDVILDIKRLLLSPGNTSILPENIVGQSLRPDERFFAAKPLDFPCRTKIGFERNDHGENSLCRPRRPC